MHRLYDPHDPLLAILVAVATPAPRRRRLGRGQGDRVAPGVGDSGPPVRIGVGEDAVRLVELVGVGVGVEVAAVRLVDLVELAVRSAPAGRVVARFADAVAVQLHGRGAEGGEAGADDAGAAFDFGPDGGVDGAPFGNVSGWDTPGQVRGGGWGHTGWFF